MKRPLIVAEYKKKRKEITKRLEEFEKNLGNEDEHIFAELCFCLLTPQSKAVNCNKALCKLRKKKLLLEGSANKIKPILKRWVRFHNKKAEYIVLARKALTKKGRLRCKEFLGTKNVFFIRDKLVKEIKGLGYKEASHFLRNIGLGRDIAIIDRHVIRNLKKERVVKKVPETITKKNYLEIENKMREFAQKNNIPLAALDLLFWSNETGFIFK